MLFHQLWPDSLLDAKLPQLFTLAKERRPWVCGFQPFLGGHLLRYWDVLWKKWIQNQQCVILEACPNKPNTYSILIIVLGIGVKEPRPTFSRTIAVGLSMSHFSSPKKKTPTGRLAGGMIGTSNEHGCDAGQICTISAIRGRLYQVYRLYRIRMIWLLF